MQKQIFRGMLPALGAGAAVCAAAAALMLFFRLPPLLALPLAAVLGFAAAALLAWRAAQHTAQSAEHERRRLLYERERLAEILGCLSEGILVLDRDGQVRYANTAACTALYTDRGALLGHAFFDIPAAASLRPRLAAALQRGEPSSADITLPDGRIERASLYPTALGTSPGALVVLLDVTAEREAAAVRRQFFDSAEEILRTPVRNIKGLCELLTSDMPLGGNKQEEISKRMLREASNLTQLIGKLLILSRMENGDLVFSRVPLDLADAVRACCDNMAQRAQQLGIELRSTLQPCPFSASLWEMSELTANLLDNALRYNRAGGSVSVSLTVEHGAPCLRVANTGEPIPPEQARRIFERFYRIGRGKSPGGAGLGLAIAKHIAERYGAVITVTPNPNGNTFTVRFPAADA